jgi:hypothetical protein
MERLTWMLAGIGPLLGAAGGKLGGAVAADHPCKPRPARSWAAGLFVRS